MTEPTPARLPATVLSEFLGAGKTTLLDPCRVVTEEVDSGRHGEILRSKGFFTLADRPRFRRRSPPAR